MNKFEQDITKTLYETSNRVQASSELRKRIQQQINNHNYNIVMEKDMRRRHFNMKKLVIATVAACLVVSMGCLAAGKITSYVSHSDIRTVCHDYAKIDTIYEKAGYEILIIEKFSNGYEFDSADAYDIQGEDDAGNKLQSDKGISVNYKQGGNTISYYADKITAMDTDETVPKATRKIGDVTVNYREDTYKFVPCDYELTEEDKQNEQRDDYFISVGSDEVMIEKLSGVDWVKDGIHYSLFGFDTGISAEELFQMTSEIMEPSVIG